LFSDLEKLARGCTTVSAYRADRSLGYSGTFVSPGVASLLAMIYEERTAIDYKASWTI